MKYFCWERSIMGLWIPVFYPKKPEPGMTKESAPQRSEIYEVPDNESFTSASAKHPSPPIGS